MDDGNAVRMVVTVELYQPSTNGRLQLRDDITFGRALTFAEAAGLLGKLDEFAKALVRQG